MCVAQCDRNSSAETHHSSKGAPRIRAWAYDQVTNFRLCANAMLVAVCNFFSCCGHVHYDVTYLGGPSDLGGATTDMYAACVQMSRPTNPQPLNSTLTPDRKLLVCIDVVAPTVTQGP